MAFRITYSIFLLVALFEQLHANNSETYLLSDGQLRIVSSSDKCTIGYIEINDYENGWTKLTASSHCGVSTESAFGSQIGDVICKQLGFDLLDSYKLITSQAVDIENNAGFNSIHCTNDANITNLCEQCQFQLETAIIPSCVHQDIEIECSGTNSNGLPCVAFDEYHDDNTNTKCTGNTDTKNTRSIKSYILASKPFYEDSTFILVAVIAGMIILSCIVICICNHVQTEYRNCMQFRSCIRCLTCHCMGYEGDEPAPVPFDVSDKRKRELAQRQNNRDNQTGNWFL